MSLLTVTAFAVGIHGGFIESAFGKGVPSRDDYERVEVDPEQAEAREFSGGDLLVSVSPIGITIQTADAGPLLPQEGGRTDPASPVPTPDSSSPYYDLKIEEPRILYTDGSEYVVFGEGCYNASKGSSHDKTLRFVFNRLVDTGSIETLVINGETLSK